MLEMLIREKNLHFKSTTHEVTSNRCVIHGTSEIYHGGKIYISLEMTEENASSGGLVCGCARSVMLDAKPFHSSITGKWQQKKGCLEIKFLSSMAGQQINLCAARIDENHDDFILENYDFV